MIFLIIFSVCLLFSTIYLFAQKKYLYIFIPCMIFLPDYYGIELSSTLPILTVRRMMFLLLFVYAIINNRKNISAIHVTNIKFHKEFFFLIGYFAFRILSNLYYASSNVESLKSIFEIIFEQVLLLIALYMISPTSLELKQTLKILVYVSFILFVIGIFESFTFIRPFDSLYTVSRYMLNDHYIRLGMLRSTTTMGLPNYFANICLIALPIAFFLYNECRDNKFLIVIFFDLFAIIHSGCRSIFFLSLIICLLYFSFVTKDKNERLHFIRNTIAILSVILLTIITLSVFNERYRYYYVGTGKSLLNEIGFNYDLDEDAPEGINGYGENSISGKSSRLDQLSGIVYTFSINPLFGLGSAAQVRNEIMYYTRGQWRKIPTYDLGIVEIIGNEGCLGIVAFLFLYIFVFYIIINNTNFSSKSKRIAVIMILAYLFSTINTANMMSVLSVLLSILLQYYLNSSNTDMNKQ